jgi:hypothetical protein
MKNFSDLTEQELLALAITLEEEDSAPTATSRMRCARAIPEQRGCSPRWRWRRTATVTASSAASQVFVGGLLVFATGIAIGSG